MEAKNFTKNGAKFMPSRMLGVGRKYIEEEAHNIRFVKGSELLKEYPKAIIPFKKREEFF